MTDRKYYQPNFQILYGRMCLTYSLVIIVQVLEKIFFAQYNFDLSLIYILAPLFSAKLYKVFYATKRMDLITRLPSLENIEETDH